MQPARRGTKISRSSGSICHQLDFYFIFYFIEKLRQLTHVVGTLSHKGIARRALPASGVKGVDGGNRKENKGE